jgi:hypothetical protein
LLPKATNEFLLCPSEIEALALDGQHSRDVASNHPDDLDATYVAQRFFEDYSHHRYPLALGCGKFPLHVEQLQR